MCHTAGNVSDIGRNCLIDLKLIVYNCSMKVYLYKIVIDEFNVGRAKPSC